MKVEGAGKVGERAYIVAGVRDPQNIARIDAAIEWSRNLVEDRCGPPGAETYSLYFHTYGKNGVMGDLEPARRVSSHELCIIVEAIARDQATASMIAKLGARGIFYARIDTKGTAGGAAYLTEDVLVGKPAYRWTLNHLVTLDDPYSMFPITMEDVGS